MRRRIIALALAALMSLAMGVTASASVSQAIPITGGVATFDPVNGFMVDQHALFESPPTQYKPGARWWLPEGVNTDDVLRANVKTLYEMGISQIEIVCRGEAAVDARYTPDNLDTSIWGNDTSQEIYSWGSQEWLNDEKVIIQEATKYGMGFSLTSGTNWSNANLPYPYLKPDDPAAGRSLGYAVTAVSPGEDYNSVLARSAVTQPTGTPALVEDELIHRQDLVKVVAIKVDPTNAATITATRAISGTATFASATAIDLTDLVTINGQPAHPDGGTTDPLSFQDAWGQDPSGLNPAPAKPFAVDWTAPDDGYTYWVISFWMQPTGASATPSATHNYAINYIDSVGMQDAIQYYEQYLFNDPDLVAAVKANGKGEMYMDSLEVSSTNGTRFWGSEFLGLFEQGRGYDLTPYLPYIIGNTPTLAGSDGVLEAKVRADLFETMTDTYRDNVLKPLQAYLHTMDMKLRAEITYGVTYEITTPVQYVDYTETESFEFDNNLDSFRVQAGGAHIWGERLSSEMGAVMNSNYVYGQDKFMQIINTQFAAGVTFNVFHGYGADVGGDASYVPNANFWTATQWPGHEGMNANISERWGPRQPAYQHYDDYMAMIARAQMLNQQGIPQVDIGILHTDYNMQNGLSRLQEGGTAPDWTRDNLGFYWQDMALQNNGYTYDYFAPENLNLLAGTGVTMYDNGELLPSRVGYHALIVYQDALSIAAAQQLLTLAQQGMPIIFVDNVIEDPSNSNNVAIPANKLSTNPSGEVVAASRTLSLGESDTDLQALVAQIKTLPNVVYLPNGAGYDPANPYDSATLEALHSLGVYPRTELTNTNKNIFAQLRKDGTTDYVYAYNALSDYDYNDVPMPEAQNGPTTFDMSVDAVGKPYLIDPWTGDITEVGMYTIANGRTTFSVTLQPGETAYFAIDTTDPGAALHAVSSTADKVTLTGGALTMQAEATGNYTTTLSDGTKWQCAINAPADIPLTDWTLMVDSYTNGDKVVTTESEKNGVALGYTTQNVSYETKHTELGPYQLTELKPWKDIPELVNDPANSVGAGVSGVGTYTTTFTLPDTWDPSQQGAYLSIGSLNSNTAQVTVNGVRSVGFDFVSRVHDISSLLKPGENTISIGVSSTLENVLRSLSQQVGVNNAGVNNTFTNRRMYVDPNASATNPWQSYGMVGDVQVVTYGIQTISAEAPTVTLTADKTPVNGWNSSDVTVSATSSDPSYTVHLSAATVGSQSPSDPIVVSTEGTTTISAMATCDCGAASDVATLEVRIDKTAPTVTAAVSGGVLTLTAMDALSGVASSQYSLDGTTWTPYTGPVAVAGPATVRYRATDKAGNVSAAQTINVAGPSASPTVEPSGSVTEGPSAPATPPPGNAQVPSGGSSTASGWPLLAVCLLAVGVALVPARKWFLSRNMTK
ncbi:MAG: hypothetical protein FWD75_07860 [Propionibacteriaceae bacterium]|nr:hypothetical protein [Propionibacteriaceae bacterium]